MRIKYLNDSDIRIYTKVYISFDFSKYVSTFENLLKDYLKSNSNFNKNEFEGLPYCILPFTCPIKDDFLNFIVVYYYQNSLCTVFFDYNEALGRRRKK